MSPINDTFLTVARDGTFKLWDFRAPGAVVRGDCER
jgi:hypothetical protein